MKKTLYYIILLFLIINCKSQNKKDLQEKEYSKNYINSLIDSLQNVDESVYKDNISPLSEKIIHIGKPAIPYLLKRLNDTISTKTYITTQCVCYNGQKPYYTIGDMVHSYIWQIYYNEFNIVYNNLDSLRKNYLKPSEEDIIEKIIPEIKEMYKSDTILRNNTRNTNMNLYDYYIRNQNIKLSEFTKRQKYKEEFIKSLNKEL